MTARLPILAAFSVLAACAVPERGPILTTTADLHKPVVTEEVARLDLPADRAAIAAFISEHRAAGHGPMVVSAPAGENPTRMAEDVVSVAGEMGVAPPEIVLAVSGEESTQSGGSPHNLTFVRYRAQVAECGVVWPSLSQTARSETYANFGCAQNANLAAMIADPADLIAPRPLGPAQAERGVAAVNAYRAGPAGPAGGAATAGGGAAAAGASAPAGAGE